MPERTLVISIIGDNASARKAFAGTGTAAAAASRQVDAAGRSVESTGTKIEKFGKGMSTVGGSLSKYVSLPLVGVGAAAVKMGLDFDKTMLLVETHTESTKAQVDEYKKAILEMSQSGKYTQGPNELGEAMYHIASDGYHGKKAIDALKQSADLAMLGQSGLAETTYAVVSAMKTGIKGTEDLHETIGILNGTMGAGDTQMGELTASLSTGVVPAAKAAGLELTDVGAAIAFMTARGVPAQKAAYGLAMNFQQLVPYTEKAKDATKRLGLGLDELGEKAEEGPRGWLHALQDLKEHLEGLPKFAQTQAIEELFGGGRTSRGILAQLQNLKDLEATYERLETIEGRTDKNLKTARESEANQWQEEWAQLQADLVELGNELTPVLLPILKEVSHDVGDIAHEFDQLPAGAKHWIVVLGLAAAALGPVTKGVGGIITLVGRATKAFEGMTGAEEASNLAMGGVIPAGRTATTAAASAESAALPVGWLGTERRAEQASLQRAGELSSRDIGVASAGISEGDATRDALSLGLGSSSSAARSATLSSARSIAGSLGKGLLTYGVGGLVVGQVVKEVGDSDLATKVGDAIQGAGVGAAIGSAIAPGIGTGIGAAVGGIAGIMLDSVGDEGAELEQAGAKEARSFLNGFRKERESGRLQKLVDHGALGREGQRQGAGDVPGTEYGTTYREGATGLRGVRAELRDKRQSAEYSEQPKAVIKAYSDELAAVNRQIAAIKNARANFSQVLGQMKGDVALGMGAIDRDLVAGLSEADTAWGQGTSGWRTHTAEAMEGAVASIEEGMDDGTIKAKTGQKQIDKLLGEIHLIKGDDPFGLAKATSDSFKKAGGITSSGVKKWEAELEQMPKAARTSSIDSTNKMLQAWADGHPKIERQIESLTKFEISHFGATNKQLREGVKKGATGPVAEAFYEAATGVGGALDNIGTNTNAMLKALGLHDMVEFEAIVFGPSRMGGTQLNSEGGGSRVAGDAKHHNYAGGGLARVGGQGLNDTVGLQVNGVMSAMVAPGEDLMVVNRHQRGPLDYAVANTFGVAGMDGFFGAFDRPHYAAKGGEVKVAGPGLVGAVGHGALSHAAAAVNRYFEAHEPKPSTGTAATYSGKVPSGVGSFDGYPVDKWIIPELEYAVAHGWDGRITSGYRTPQHSAELGFPDDEHTKTSYPGGAVDFGGMHEAAALANRAAFMAATVGYKGPKLLLPIGFVDDGHMSGTGHARGGAVIEGSTPAVDKFLARAWGHAAGLYGQSPRSAYPAGDYLARGLTGTEGDVGKVEGAPGHKAVFFDKGWMGRAMAGNRYGEESLLHEWAHVFQKPGLSHWQREGGATDFARWAGPGVFGIDPAGMPWPGGGYKGFGERVADQLGQNWIEHGQFKARGGRIGTGKALHLSKQGQAVQDLMQSVWPSAAPFYGGSPSSMPPANFDTTAWGGAFVGDNKVFGKNGKLAKNYLGYPKWFEGWIGKKPNVVKETLIHEWAHYFQRNNLAGNPPLREGGAEAFALWAAPQIYSRAGIKYQNPPLPKSATYYPWVQRVKAEKGWPWIEHGQFRARGGRLPRFAGGGNVSGKVSWFNGGATAGGGNTSQPGIAMNLNPGTESGWDNPTTQKWMEESRAGHPVYADVSIDGHSADLPIIDLGPAGFTQRAIDVTEGGVKKLGFSTSDFPTDATGTAVIRGSAGAVATGAGSKGHTSTVKPAIGESESTGATTRISPHGTPVGVGALKPGKVTASASWMPPKFKKALQQPGLSFAQKVEIAEEAVTYGEEHGENPVGASAYGMELEKANKTRIQKQLAKVNRELQHENSPGQRKKLLAQREHLLEGLHGANEELSSFREAGSGEEGPSPEQEAIEAQTEAIEKAAEEQATREEEEKAAMEAHTEAIKELTQKMGEQTALATSAIGTNSAVAWQALAEILGGTLGPKIAHQELTPGDGQLGTV
jgi:TP901 family phage tail tape measure protein